MDAPGKALLKRPSATGKKGVETAKTSMPKGKTGLKRPSDMDMLSTKSAKRSTKTVPHTIASMATARGTLGASGPKNALGALGPKAGAGISGSKAARGVLSSKPSRGNSGSKAAGGNLGSKATEGNSGSKVAGGTPSLKAEPSAKKVVAPTKKCRVPWLVPWLGYLRKSHKNRRHTVRRFMIQRLRVKAGASQSIFTGFGTEARP
jgi:hypothetical protein